MPVAQVRHELIDLDGQINAAFNYVDAEMPKVVGQAKVDLEAQQAKMRADREKLNAQLKASYEAQVKHIKNGIARMQIWAQTTDAKNRAKVNAELNALRQQVADVELQIQSLIAVGAASLNEKSAKVERAMADLKKGRERAIADLDEGYEKAKAEFNKPA